MTLQRSAYTRGLIPPLYPSLPPIASQVRVETLVGGILTKKPKSEARKPSPKCKPQTPRRQARTQFSITSSVKISQLSQRREVSGSLLGRPPQNDMIKNIDF